MRVTLTPKAMIAALVAAGLCLGLGACGVRGSLDPPPSAKAAGTAKSAEAAGTQPGSAAPPKPHETFVLDPLLR
jgi:predicted small lipoprotein YifL